MCEDLLFGVLSQQAPGGGTRKQRSGVQLCGAARLNWSRRSHSRSLREPVQPRFSLFASGFRVAAHGFNRNRAPDPIVCRTLAPWRSPGGVPFCGRELLAIKTLARMQSSCNHLLLPFDWAKEELSVEPKRGFGLMFLSAVEFHALHGLQGSALTHSH